MPLSALRGRMILLVAPLDVSQVFVEPNHDFHVDYHLHVDRRPVVPRELYRCVYLIFRAPDWFF